MVVALFQYELFIPESHSLKSKRQIVKSIKDKVRKAFNISIAETGFQEKWQRCELSCAMVASSEDILNSSFEKINALMVDNYNLEMLKTNLEFLI